MELIQRLAGRKLLHPPDWLAANVQYAVIMGSEAYGMATESSDTDIYGFAIPPKATIFPHLAGVIPGFGHQGQRFDQFQQHHVADADARKEYDFTIYGIVKFFALAADCNPNIIDCLFVPDYCIKHATAVGQLVRDNRRLFLSKLAWPKFRGYAYSQLHKLRPVEEPYSSLLKDMMAFEEHHDIDPKTTLAQVEDEMKRRQSDHHSVECHTHP